LTAACGKPDGGTASGPMMTSDDVDNGELEAVSDDPPPKLKADVVIRDDKLIRRDDSGVILWSVELKDPISGFVPPLVRPPHCLFDKDRAYATDKDGVTAFDMKTGKSLWHEAGPSERMCLSGNLLLATSCGIDPWVTQHGRCVIARTVTTGAEVFRV